MLPPEKDSPAFLISSIAPPHCFIHPSNLASSGSIITSSPPPYTVLVAWYAVKDAERLALISAVGTPVVSNKTSFCLS